MSTREQRMRAARAECADQMLNCGCCSAMAAGAAVALAGGGPAVAVAAAAAVGVAAAVRTGWRSEYVNQVLDGGLERARRERERGE